MLFAAALIGAAGFAADGAFAWRAATPESHGFSTPKLDALRNELAARRTKALFVVHDDRVIYEWYSADHSATKPHGTASMAKAIVGGVALGVAISDGRIALDTILAEKFVPQWRGDPLKARIAVRHLGSHSSGIEDAEADGKPHNELTGWKGDFWKRHAVPNDPFTLSRDAAPMLFAPGTSRAYSNPGIAMMDYAVTAALRDAPEKDLRTLLRERVMRPIGVADAEWSCGYGRTFHVDGLPLVGSWGGGNYTARATARICRLMLREGEWDGRRLLRADAVRQITRDAGTPGPGGMGWWNNEDGHIASLPRDAFWGAGAGGQVGLVVPSLKLIVVRNGGSLDPGDNDRAVEKHLFNGLMAALGKAGRVSDGSMGVIEDLAWAPKETILRRAKGGDNWPLTWADDDALYTAYGDGNGFEPFIAEKLSLGLAKVTGAPPDFRGVNLRAPTVEARGNDVHGHKASGLLMVDGVLYLLVRNVANAQLAWSRDHGATWTWAEWKFTESFGAPTFINFGRNYAGARDEFVYALSHDAPTAYNAADGFVLARVPKGRIAEQAAWEFFAGEKNGQPQWSREVARRAPVLRLPGQAFRAGVSYNAPLRRYLLVHPVPSAKSRDRAGKIDTRFTAGLAIHEAPEPWGPWRTVYRTGEWDVGPGETASFPPKWMSADGRTLQLVFSGDDYFSVREAKLVLSERAVR